jgi:cobalt-precorrin 5A hydrolase
MLEEFGRPGVFRFQKTMPRGLKKGVPLVVVSPWGRAGVKPPFGCRPALILRPREFVLGVGTRRGVTIKEVERACMEVLRERDIAPMSVRNLATIDIKKSESGLLGFTRKSGWPVEYFSAKELGGVRLPSGHSKVVERNVGLGGVAEPAALKSAGARRIWVRKRINGRVTVAVARVPSL